MYNGVYRTMIDDNEARKFLDTFVGPTVSAASMMRIFRNGVFSLTTRISLGLFVPLSRERTLYLLRFFTFTLFKQTIFSEIYLHQRLWRHIFENGCGLIGLSTYYAVFKFKKAFLDPPPEVKKEEGSKLKASTNGSSIKTKGKGIQRNGFEYQTYNPYEYNYVQSYDYKDTSLPGANLIKYCVN